jgi:hypothetical protein
MLENYDSLQLERRADIIFQHNRSTPHTTYQALSNETQTVGIFFHYMETEAKSVSDTSYCGM